jgi:hypothetical protein
MNRAAQDGEVTANIAHGRGVLSIFQAYDKVSLAGIIIANEGMGGI